ncbi:AAA family ATPase [Nonomuraea sp. NPDC048916]|uniref:helix-turn-helix transcriptional regulator n=1 Tax=Nonomuraea sp. NPDC048916 TaxID=3154232 RepID=UPI0033ECA497
MRSQFEQSSAGAGRVVMVSGGVASGKTTLLNDLLDEATAAGAVTLSATGAPDEQRIESAIIDQLLANSSTPVTGAAKPYTALGLCDTLQGLARERPTVICVDGIHYADETSVRILLQLQRRIRSVKLLMVLSRPEWPRGSPAGFDLQHRCYGVRLAPLPEQTIAAMLDAAGHNHSGLAARLHALSGGNPMFAKAAVDDHLEGLGHDGRAVAGPAYAQAVWAFLHRSEDHLLDVATALAVLGECGDAELIAKLTGIDADAVVDVLAVLEQGGLLAGGWFRHPDAPTAVLRNLPTTERIRLHRAAAELKYREAAAATEVASNLVSAGETSAEWSLPILRRAAERALMADDIAFATRCLELGLSAASDEAEQRSIHLSIVRSTWRVNPSGVLPHISALAAAADQGELDQAGCLALLRHALWHGDRQNALRAHELLHTGPGPIDPQIDTAVKLAFHWHFGQDLPQVKSSDFATHPGAAPWNHTAHSLTQTWRQGSSDTTKASAERVLRNSRLGDTTLEAIAMAISALAHGGNCDRAQWWCGRLAKEARQRGATSWQAMIEALRAAVVLQRGEVTKAAELARSALDMLSEPNWGVSISHPLTTLLMADIAAGTFASAAETLRRPVPDAMLETVGGLWFLRACGHFYLATKRPLAAIGYFHKVQRLMRTREESMPLLVPWRSDLAEATLRLGNRTIARDLANQQIELAHSSNPFAHGLALRALALAGTPAEGSRSLLERAAKSFQQAGHQLELNRTLKVIAQLQNPERERLNGLAADAIEAPRPVPASRLMVAQDARPEPVAREDGRSERAESVTLSEAELRVAQLAALGHTNRQISRRLFITISTVEQHLTRTYRKLDIRGRSALAHELGYARISI